MCVYEAFDQNVCQSASAVLLRVSVMAQPWGDNPLSKCPTNTVKCHGIIVSVHACMHVHTEEVHSHTDSDQRGFFFLSFASVVGKTIFS